MKYTLAALSAFFLSAVVDAQPNGPPSCDLQFSGPPGVTSPPGQSAVNRNVMSLNVPPGRANSAGQIKVCSENFPGGSKAFSVVSSSPFGPDGGQPLESWSGRSDDGSELTFVINERGHSTGSLVNPNDGTITDIYTDEDTGATYTEKHNVSDYPDEADPEEVVGVDLTVGVDDLHRRLRGGGSGSVADNVFDTTQQSLQGKDQRRLQADHTFDVLVLYTTKARAAKGNTDAGMLAAISTAITETNDAYRDSGVNAQLRLVHWAHTAYTETSTDAFGNALSALRTNGDGLMDEAHTLRSQYGADVVALIIDEPTYCGLGYLGPRTDLMFSVTKASCMTGYYSFGHEIGHNLGCHHDRGATSSCSSSNYNFGWRDPQANFRSIMAYNCASGQCDGNNGGGCTRVKMFSNANYNYGNKAIGNAQNDNARVINEVAAEVAGYYNAGPTPPPPTPVPPTPVPPTPAPEPTPVPPAVTKYYCHKKDQTADDICVNGVASPFCTPGTGTGCGPGGKTCYAAQCGGGAPPAPEPTSAPPPGSCLPRNAQCSQGTCCNGCKGNGLCK